MNLTGKQLVERGIITGEITELNIQQHGVDLEVIGIARIVALHDEAFIPAGNEKTRLASRIEVQTQTWIDPAGNERQVWRLQSGAYEVVFKQGCVVPPDQRLQIVQRSSLLRNGGILRSSVFDAGFVTENIGTVIHLGCAVTIEYSARIAQIVAEGSNVVENLYNGQWQNDKQRSV